MTDRPSSSRTARVGAAVLLTAGVVAALAARPQAAATTQATTQPPTTTAAPIVAPLTAPPTAPQDTMMRTAAPQDSVSAQGVPTLADSAQPSVTQKEEPAATGMWPVDPNTGMTLVNGEPVVGRVFVMQKVDGLRKYEGVSRHYVGEPLPPEPAVVGTSYRQPDLSSTRRHRGAMVQSNLWSIERKRSAMETHHYRPMVNPMVNPGAASTTKPIVTP